MPYTVRVRSSVLIVLPLGPGVLTRERRCGAGSLVVREYAAGMAELILGFSARPWVVEHCKRVEDTDADWRGEACRWEQSLGHGC